MTFTVALDGAPEGYTITGVGDGLILEVLKETARPLVVGLVTSVHCVGMCGPIGCGLSAMPASECWP